MLRTDWSLADIKALPDGEHDYFDRKSGLLLEKSNFRTDFGKAISAISNSGGGHLVIGVEDNGTIDGVPRTKGRTCIREWIEQIIPSLVEPVPTAFRVHLVDSNTEIVIPDDRVVIVVDIDDSFLAPFQSRATKLYYHRVGGHSVPASHFYLETLRNRTRVPSFLVSISETRIMRVLKTKSTFFVQIILHLEVTNDGNVTPSNWYIDLFNDGERIADSGLIRRFGFPTQTISFPDHQRVHTQSVLPGQTRKIAEILGICVDHDEEPEDFPKLVIEQITGSNLTATVVSESHIGSLQELNIQSILDTVSITSLLDHMSEIDDNSVTGSLGAGVYLKSFKLDDYEDPDDHVYFRGLIENSSDVHFRKFKLVTFFLDEDDHITGYEITDVGMLPPKSQRHWKDWIVAANIWNASRIDVLYYDEDWLEP